MQSLRESNHPRLLALLGVSGMSGLEGNDRLPQGTDIEEVDRSSRNSVMENSDSESLENDIVRPTPKRVFCNIFTGCGGKFRVGRRKHHRPSQHIARKRFLFPDTDKYIIGKRIFCNPQGCFNGKKRSGSEMNIFDQLKPAASKRARNLSRINSFLVDTIKRPFCNFGGCANAGKRTTSVQQSKRSGLTSFPLTSDDLGGPIVAPVTRASFQNWQQMKRFFAGGYDNDMQSLIDSLKR